MTKKGKRPSSHERRVRTKNGRRTRKINPNIKKRPCPGSKIRSKGLGRGLGIGKGMGPIGRRTKRSAPIGEYPSTFQPITLGEREEIIGQIDPFGKLSSKERSKQIVRAEKALQGPKQEEWEKQIASLATEFGDVETGLTPVEMGRVVEKYHGEDQSKKFLANIRKRKRR